MTAWECPGLDGDAFVICRKDRKGKRRTVAHVYGSPDARLIVAAPDLLAALRSTLNTLGLMADSYPLGSATRNTLEDECAAIRTAIAKATA